MHNLKVLVVDDEPQICFTIRRFLENHKYEVFEAGSCEGALRLLDQVSPDAIILDYSLPDGNSMGLIRKMRKMLPNSPIIVLTGHGTIELAVQAIKEGAEHFLTKPVQLQVLKLTMERELENQRNRYKVRVSETQQKKGKDPFRGSSKAIRLLSNLAKKAAHSDRPVLIQGETGTGKGVLANWLHLNSPRAKEAFVDINCAGLSRELLESELFGYEKGAFTGAVNSKVGLMEAAHRGTIFLDEISDAEISVQAKLLKAVEENKFRRLGEVRDRQVDIRLIAATHRNLQEAVASKAFRSDLYYRISVVVLEVPSLRQRIEDIEDVAQELLKDFAMEQGRDNVVFAPNALEALKKYSWPGNIRELRNVLDRALLVNEGDVIQRGDLMFGGDTTQPAHQDVPADTVSDMEKQHIMKVLTEEKGNVIQASKRLGIPRSSLYKKIKNLRPGPPSPSDV